MNYKIEADWTTKAGYRAVCIMTRMGHRNGYVGLPPKHPCFGFEYSEWCPALEVPEKDEQVGKRGMLPLMIRGRARVPDVVFDVHGGLTFSGGDFEYPVKARLWWFGFDCGHAGDKPEFPTVSEEGFTAQVLDAYKRIEAIYTEHGEDTRVVRTKEYVVEECESLAAQLNSRVNHALWMNIFCCLVLAFVLPLKLWRSTKWAKKLSLYLLLKRTRKLREKMGP